jgi:hypothetical protein
MRAVLAIVTLAAFFGNAINVAPSVAGKSSIHNGRRDPFTRKVLLAGEAALKYTAQREQKDPKFAKFRNERRKRALEKGYTHIDDRAMVLRAYTREAPKTTLENLAALFIHFVAPTVEAQDEYTYCYSDCPQDYYDAGGSGGADESFFGFDTSDSYYTIGFTSYTQDYDAGIISAGDFEVNPNDPQGDYYVSANLGMAVDNTWDDAPPAPPAPAKTWQGIPCSDHAAINEKFLYDSYAAGAAGGGGGLAVCFLSGAGNIGLPLCAAGGFIGGFFGAAIVASITSWWSCRKS